MLSSHPKISGLQLILSLSGDNASIILFSFLSSFSHLRQPLLPKFPEQPSELPPPWKKHGSRKIG
jgi:hypothetical protein